MLPQGGGGDDDDDNYNDGDGNKSLTPMCIQRGNIVITFVYQEKNYCWWQVHRDIGEKPGTLRSSLCISVLMCVQM